MNVLKKKFRSIKKFPTWIYWLPARLMQLALHTLYRYEINDPENWAEKAQGIVGVCWHNRLFFFAAAFPAAVRKRTCAVVSASRDGQYIADLIKCFGLRSARGSSSKGGAQAQLEASRALKAGNHVSFTPDGPRGPRYHLSKGPIPLASLHQVPVVPVAVNASRYWECKSWDRFQIPKPFSTLTVMIGEPIPIPADLDAEGLEKYRKIVEAALNEVSAVRPEDIPTAEEIAEMQRKKAAKKAAKAAQAAQKQ